MFKRININIYSCRGCENCQLGFRLILVGVLQLGFVLLHIDADQEANFAIL